jgi:hypothetical protein
MTNQAFSCSAPRIQVFTGLLYHPIANCRVSVHAHAFRCLQDPPPNRPTARVSVHALPHSGVSRTLPPQTNRQSFSARTPHSGGTGLTTLIDQLPEFQCTHSRIQFKQDSYSSLIDQLTEFQCTHSQARGDYRTPTTLIPTARVSVHLHSGGTLIHTY